MTVVVVQTIDKVLTTQRQQRPTSVGLPTLLLVLSPSLFHLLPCQYVHHKTPRVSPFQPPPPYARDTLAALNGQSRGAAGAGGAPPAGAPGAEANMMQQMMEAMGGGAGGGMQEMMDNMLQNLLSKETLYEPMVGPKCGM